MMTASRWFTMAVLVAVAAAKSLSDAQWAECQAQRHMFPKDLQRNFTRANVELYFTPATYVMLHEREWWRPCGT